MRVPYPTALGVILSSWIPFGTGGSAVPYRFRRNSKFDWRVPVRLAPFRTGGSAVPYRFRRNSEQLD
jgi:hypothetical protein